jgi:hypothetical protein
MGLVLVFDMDQTILDSSDPYLFERPPTPEAKVILKRKIREALNWNVVNIMKRAVALRPSGQVSAICLLTNNSSTILVSAVDEVLLEEIGSRGKYKTTRRDSDDKDMPDKAYFFDSIMMRQHTSRPKTVDDNPPKRFVDIIKMLSFIGIYDMGIENMKDVYFFDDIGTHDLRSEFNFMSQGKYKDHYIHITPPYNKLFQDRTDYRSILQALSAIDGQPPELPMMSYQIPRSSQIPPRSVPYNYGKPNATGRLPSAGPPTATPYRPRSNTRVNANNLGLPPPPQEQSLHKRSTISRPSLMGAFAPPSNKGGSRKTRKRRRDRRYPQGSRSKNLRLSRRK